MSADSNTRKPIKLAIVEPKTKGQEVAELLAKARTLGKEMSQDFITNVIALAAEARQIADLEQGAGPGVREAAGRLAKELEDAGANLQSLAMKA